MGVTTKYLGHVEIVPTLNQAEYDYLSAFADSRRSRRPEGPYAVTPKEPDHESGDHHNWIGDGQPSYYCQWGPCPHGCCLVWDGREKFYAGPAWLQYLIDNFLRVGALAQTGGDPQFADFTFDHRMNGVVVGEQQDLRELFVLRVRDDVVTQETLRPGDPDFGQPDYRGLEDRPWLAGDRPPRWTSLDDFEPLTVVPPRPTPRRRPRKG